MAEPIGHASFMFTQLGTSRRRHRFSRMPDPSTYTAFLGAVLAYQLSGVGPDMMLVISRGIGQGRQAALAAALGCVAAGIIQIPLLAMGLATVVLSSPPLYKAMQLIGAAYLIYVGFRFLAAGETGKEQDYLASASLVGAFRQGMICNLTNPAALSFMLAILPQFVHPSAGSPALQFAIMAGTMKATGLLILGTAALASGAFSGWLARNRPIMVWQQRIAGTIMVALGIRLLFPVAVPSFGR
ncbi:LysE family translocator [Sinorhizobium meliloti]|uniref:LysE family translocator n=2 Tax=Rhizobium meliloti TaxID=382 RepID=UPI003F5CD7CC